MFSGNVIDSSSNGVVEYEMTYTSTGTKLTLASSTVGTAYGEVIYED